MNNIFNIKRFGLVFRKEYMENWKRYMMYFFTMLGIMTVVITWQTINHYDIVEKGLSSSFNLNLNKQLLQSLWLMFFVFWIIFASTCMTPMSSKFKRISYLVSPSSNFEKYLSRWIIVTVAYIILFFIALWVADVIRVVICSVRYSNIDVMFIDFTKLIYTGEELRFPDYLYNKKTFIVVLSSCVLLQSICILGSTFWEKSTFRKTFVAGALIVLVYSLLYRWTVILFYGDFNVFNEILESSFNEDKVFVFMSCILCIFTLTNWILAFFRFCESEIIKRL